MTAFETRPLIVQSDQSLLLDVHSPCFDEARATISAFAELVKSPEHIHTYYMSPLSLWNAASAGYSAEKIIDILGGYSRYPMPENIAVWIREIVSRYGKLVLEKEKDEERLILKVYDRYIWKELASNKKLSSLLSKEYADMNGTNLTPQTAKTNAAEAARTDIGDADWFFIIDPINRGTVKQRLAEIGYPVADYAPLGEGEPLSIQFRDECSSGAAFHLRDYQREAAEAFYGRGEPGTGFGTIVLPCGAGKTVVGMAIMEIFRTSTLILTTNIAAVHQWMDELLDKTDIDPSQIGEYSGDKKEIKPITIGTYQILVWRPNREEAFPHFRLFSERNWGLVIYDEVHLLPAPVFRVTAEIQALRRLGLTATLIREDGRERDVFSLVGPKRCDIPWKELEAKGWIAEANCYEIRIDLPEKLKVPYAVADKRNKFRIASENPLKGSIVSELIENHREDSVMVIGQYVRQLTELAKELEAPLITGKTANKAREEIYAAFRKGEIQTIVVSKVANFAIDLPDASVAIQISGTFGSRQEEAQRLGRILRPKDKNSFFYSLVSRYTSEEQFAAKRQKFLTEQGYRYHIEIRESGEYDE